MTEIPKGKWLETHHFDGKRWLNLVFYHRSKEELSEIIEMGIMQGKRWNGINPVKHGFMEVAKIPYNNPSIIGFYAVPREQLELYICDKSYRGKFIVAPILPGLTFRIQPSFVKAFLVLCLNMVSFLDEYHAIFFPLNGLELCFSGEINQAIHQYAWNHSETEVYPKPAPPVSNAASLRSL